MYQQLKKTVILTSKATRRIHANQNPKKFSLAVHYSLVWLRLEDISDMIKINKD